MFLMSFFACLQFARKCITLFTGWRDCVEMIEHLKGLCYSMDKALEVLEPINKVELERMGGYNRIQLKYEEWKEMKDLVKGIKHECLLESTKEENQKEDYGQTNSYEVIKVYKEWLNADGNLEKSECGCPEVFGLYRLFNLR